MVNAECLPHFFPVLNLTGKGEIIVFRRFRLAYATLVKIHHRKTVLKDMP